MTGQGDIVRRKATGIVCISSNGSVWNVVRGIGFVVPLGDNWPG